jgi:hypothetical protein
VNETFAELLVQRLKAQASLLRSLTGHPTLVGTGRESAFRQLLHELVPRRYEVLEGTIGRTKDQLQLGVDVIAAMFIFADDITASELRTWLGEAIEIRNRWASTGEQKPSRDALAAIVLPNYIVTSGGFVVEKLIANQAYRFYEAEPAVAVAFLLTNLLRAVALPPEDAEHYGVLVTDPVNKAPSSKLAAAYTEFAEHLGSPTLPPPSGSDLNLTDPPPTMS